MFSVLQKLSEVVRERQGVEWISWKLIVIVAEFAVGDDAAVVGTVAVSSNTDFVVA